MSVLHVYTMKIYLAGATNSLQGCVPPCGKEKRIGIFWLGRKRGRGSNKLPIVMPYLAHADSTLHPLAQWFTIYTSRSIARHMQKGRTVRSSLTLLKQILIHIAFHEAANVFDWQLSLSFAWCGMITYLFIERQNHFPNDSSTLRYPVQMRLGECAPVCFQSVFEDAIFMFQLKKPTCPLILHHTDRLRFQKFTSQMRIFDSTTPMHRIKCCRNDIILIRHETSSLRPQTVASGTRSLFINPHWFI